MKVSVSIGVCDVESSEAAEAYLRAYQRNDLMETVAISRTGLICRVWEWTEDWIAVEVTRLTVRGKRIAPEIVEPYLIGEVKVNYDR